MRPVAIRRVGSRNDAIGNAEFSDCEHWNSRDFFEFETPEDVAERLADGADPNELDFDDRTPPHHAAVHGKGKIAAMLPEEGAGRRADEFGWTPFHGAAAAGEPGAISPLPSA